MTLSEKPKRFNIRISIDVSLTSDELWPDGNVPIDVSVKDVEALINSDRISNIIQDWGLEDDAIIDVN